METIKNYIDVHKDRFIDELFEFIRIPSISAQRDNYANMQNAAKYLSEILLKSGASSTHIFQTEGWPIVYGEKIVSNSLPTILVYGHYDVQPVEPLDLWVSHPFRPEIRDEKIFARGADDDKGQLFMHIKAFEFMVHENKLPCNVKFIVEGEEEIGSLSLQEFCKQNTKLLKADLILVSDTSMLSIKTPTITTGLRGLAYFELVLSGQNRDLHSGLYGGVVKNPCNVLCSIIDKLIDNFGHITIPGFYDSVLETHDVERKILNSIPLNESDFFNSIGLKDGFGEEGFTLIERLGLRPSCDVNGIWGGYTNEGAKTIIPAKAYAKISMRLVPNQNPARITKQFEAYLKTLTPEDFLLELKYLHGGTPYILPLDSKEIKAVNLAYKKTLIKSPLPFRSGGSIPVISVFEENLNIKTVLMGFGLESDAIHGPNENFPLENFYKGIETIPWFYHFYVNM